jgi:alcohol dehydrogenase class IV
MRSFRYQALPSRVVFGAGCSRRELESEVDGQGKRVLLIATRRGAELAEQLAEPLGDRVIGRFTDVREHVPQEIADAARTAALEARADCLLCIGGGSVVGTAKAVAVEARLPIVAVPTTYSGSEMTPTWGLTEGGRKRTARSMDALPRVVLYDPELTTELPPSVTAASGMNALAHAVGALYLPHTDPITTLLAQEGVRALADGLPRAVAEPSNVDARAGALYGSYLAGTVLAAVGPATHHKICHVLGGAYGLPHASTHSVVLPYIAALHDDRLGRAAAVLGSDHASDGLRALAERIGAPTSLESIGLRAADLPDAIRRVAEQVEIPDPDALLRTMFAGRWPR